MAQRSCALLLAAYPHMTVARFRSAMVSSDQMLDRVCGQLRALGVPEG